MLDLQPRVHLHEVERAVLLGDELDGAGADVADGLRRRHRGSPIARGARASCPGAALPRAPSGAALHRAVALEQVRRVAVRVGENLDLDVPRATTGSARAARARRRTTPAPSRCADAKRGAKSARIARPSCPLPPPPAVALISTG
jgi:hypothetical protein